MSGVPDINWAEEVDDAIEALGPGVTIEQAHALALEYNNHTVLAALVRRLNGETAAGGPPDAADVDIADAGGYYGATTVEDALQELAEAAAIEIVIDGGGSAITTGVKGDLEVPFDCTIVSARLFADASGSIVVDVWRDTYANYPPTDADSITASAPPTLSSAAKSQDTTLTGWTKTLSKGDTLRYNVDSATTVQRVVCSLGVTRR